MASSFIVWMGGTTSGVSEGKAERVEGGGGDGRACSKMFWGRCKSSKVNESGSEKRGKYSSYIQILRFRAESRYKILTILTAYQLAAATSER